MLLEFKDKGTWMDVLPIAVWAINDLPGAVTEYSPHYIVFGRDAPAFGDEPKLHCPRSSASGERWGAFMRHVREDVAEKLQKIHKKESQKFQKKHKQIKIFKPGDWVYVQLHDFERTKLDPLYLGPCEVLDRVHDDTYTVSCPGGEKQYAFDRLKLYPKLEGDKTPLFYHRPKQISLPTGLNEDFVVDKILGHRKAPRGNGVQFKVRWRGYDASGDTWEPASHFLPRYNVVWADYCKKHGIVIDPRDFKSN